MSRSFAEKELHTRRPEHRTQPYPVPHRPAQRKLSMNRRASDSRQEDSSDDNQSSSLGRSAPSDDVSVASDYQDDGSPECEYERPNPAQQQWRAIICTHYKKRKSHTPTGDLVGVAGNAGAHCGP
ncbi:hypothetical protein SKAU_G00139000 [Synaphobranchus kaupii]|uniref:Uncharacterized protein n=1 Tax=Synaphobranchus kaupii TaxID=118154 RepID=A0A9Q1FSA9_SYNKA|nr:hypothetical protein SKAU_G00139000 [Synaphobranchus kaupii]